MIAGLDIRLQVFRYLTSPVITVFYDAHSEKNNAFFVNYVIQEEKMGIMVDTEKLLVYITDKAFENDAPASETKHIYWLYDQLKDYLEEQGEVFQYTDARIDALNDRLEALYAVQLTGKDIIDKLTAIMQTYFDARWREIDQKLDALGTDGLLLNTGLIMPFRSELTSLNSLHLRQRLIDLQITMVTFRNVDEKIQAIKNDLQDIVQDFDNYFAINT